MRHQCTPPPQIDANHAEQLTAIELRDRGIRYAECLHALGVRRGDTVALCTSRQLRFAPAMLGAFMLGACVTPISPAYTERELWQAVQLSRPTVVFAEASAAQRLRGLIETVVQFDANDAAAAPGGVLTNSAFIGDHRVPQVADGSAYECPALDMSAQLMWILYSSGTTGLPKGVEFTQQQSLLAVHRNAQRKRFDESLIGENVRFSVLPVFHTYGLSVLMSAILFGQRLVTLSRFEPAAYLRAIQTYRCSTLAVVPTLLVFLAKSPIVDQYNLRSVRVIQCAAAPLATELVLTVQRRLALPDLLVRQAYGLTEAMPALTTQTDRCHQPGSVGELMVGVWGRVVEPDSERVLGANQLGELQFCGSAMRGYVDDATATALAIGADGWLRTGDIGYYDTAGEWFVVDRLKELIKYNGAQVPPAEIEAVLLQMPQIADCAVIGLPDERAGELPTAFVVRQEADAESLSGEQVERFVRERTAPSKWLRGGVQFVAQIPRNAGGKIRRRELLVWVKTLAAKL